MGLADVLDRRFDRRAVAWSLRVFGAALVAEVVTQVLSGVWRVHEGSLYPWRHIPILPLYPTWVLAIEWALTAIAGLALASGLPRVRAIAIRVAAAVTLVSVVERYSNHGVLLFLVAFFFAMAPPRLDDPSFEESDHSTLGLLRAELVIVYVFSALNKLTHGFLSGASLANLLGVAPGVARALSSATVLAELALPLLLIFRPRVGVVGVVLLHLGFALFLSGLASFGLAMTALAVLFVRVPG